MSDFDTVREIGRELPDVVDASTDKGAALKLRGKILACRATHKTAEPNTLMIRISAAERDRLLAADPDTCYLTDHYVKYSSVLVRLERIDRRALEQVLQAGWRYMMESG